jgi:hypothetical protein
MHKDRDFELLLLVVLMSVVMWMGMVLLLLVVLMSVVMWMGMVLLLLLLVVLMSEVVLTAKS